MRNKKLYSVLALMVIASLLSGCLVAGSVVNKYHRLIELYHEAQEKAADFRLCVDTGMGTMYVQADAVQNYLEADVEKAKVWRQVLDTSGASLIEALSKYSDVPVEKLDLAELAKAGALPDQISSGFTVFVRAFQEAPISSPSDQVILAQMRTATEQYNKIDACGADWNETVKKYNIERNKIPGEVVGDLAESLGVKELPQELSYYRGDYGGTISQPKLPGQ